MKVILGSLSDPSWWFTGIFFVLVAFALPPLFRLLRRAARSLIRKHLARTRRKIKYLRLRSGLVQYAIGKANAHYTLFLALAFGFMFLLPVISALNGGKIPLLLVAGFSLPIFALEIAWLASDSFVKELVAARERFQKQERPDARRDL